MHVLKLRLPAARSDAISEWLWARLPAVLDGIEELPADGGAFFQTGPEFEVLEFGSEAAKRCAKWLEDEKFRGGDDLIFQLYLSKELSTVDLQTLARELEAEFRGPKPVEILSQVEMPGVDYLEEYKKQVTGQRLNEHLWVGPPWDKPPADVPWIFFVDPGLAFGTGEHPTTQLCLMRLLELKNEGFAPKRILDLGTGTGVLALAAKRFFPKAQIVVSDLDPACENEVKKTFAANTTSLEGIVAVYGPAGTARGLLNLGSQFDFVISNIYAEVLAQAAADIFALCCPAAKWLASGILQGPSEATLDDATTPMFSCVLRRSRTLERPQLNVQHGLQKFDETWVLKEWARS